MAETAVSRLILARRADVYSIVSAIRTLAGCLAPAGAASKVLDYDGTTLRMQITHAPGPEGARRFSLRILEARENESVVYAAAFEGDPGRAGGMKLRFTLKDAPGGTLVTARHEGLPDSIDPEANERGALSSLENLARLIEAQR